MLVSEGAESCKRNQVPGPFIKSGPDIPCKQKSMTWMNQHLWGCLASKKRRIEYLRRESNPPHPKETIQLPMFDSKEANYPGCQMFIRCCLHPSKSQISNNGFSRSAPLKKTWQSEVARKNLPFLARKRYGCIFSVSCVRFYPLIDSLTFSDFKPPVQVDRKTETWPTPSLDSRRRGNTPGQKKSNHFLAHE